MLKTILILGFTILFFAILGDEIAPYILSLTTGISIITTGVTRFAFIVNDVWDYYPTTIKSIGYFWVSYAIVKKVLLG